MYVEALIPKVTDGIWRWGVWVVNRFESGQEGGALRMGFVPLEDKTSESLLASGP